MVGRRRDNQSILGLYSEPHTVSICSNDCFLLTLMACLIFPSGVKVLGNHFRIAQAISNSGVLTVPRGGIAQLISFAVVVVNTSV